MQYRHHLKLVLAAAATAFSLGAMAADNTATGGGLTRSEAKDMKTQSDGAYKARKHVADANQDLNKAGCEVAADGSLERACKKDANAMAKQEKSEAKVIHEAEKDAIKSSKQR